MVHDEVEGPSPSPWPTDPASWAESLERFEDVPSCVERLRAGVPIELAESLADLGYDTVYDDVCHALAAAEAGDASGCEALSASALRDGCRRRVALATRDPDVCPPARGLAGRDATCLAWTTGLARLCDAARVGEERTCRAVGANDAARCRGDARCEAAVKRYGGSVAPLVAERELTGELAIETTVDERAGHASRHDEVAAAGVVLSVEGCAYRARLEVGGPLREGPQHELELLLRQVEGEWRGEVRAMRFSSTRLAIPTVAMEPRLDALRFEPRRGGVLTLEARARLASEGALRVVAQTWVRDLDPLPRACTAEP